MCPIYLQSLQNFNGISGLLLMGKSDDERYKCDHLIRQPRQFFWVDGLQSISFHRADVVLKRRLYQISFPVIRKNLYMSSKSMANLGKKPTTYLINACSARNEPVKSNSIDVVLQNRERFSLQGLPAGALKEMVKFIEFDHKSILLMNCIVDPKYYHLLFHPNVISVTVTDCGVDWETLLKLTPNAGYFRFHGPVPKNWEKKLLEWNRDNHHQNKKYYYFKVDYVADFKSLNELIRLNNFETQIWFDAKYDKDQLYEYFKESNFLSTFMQRNCLYLRETDASYYPIIFSSWLF